MTKNFFYLFLLSAVPFLSSCEAIGTIFKAGMWWAFILVFIVVAVILWIISKAKK
ncbi:MAG: phosphatidate cytidylyltransferase [Gloeobacteraceae cyanobacterium ES-bin-316]|nr:phosphatidate cytidylyltransferase [Ferruginibacter sp.]